MKTTEVILSGELQTVRIPEEFRFSDTHVSIRREGEAVILEPLKPQSWPSNFFEQIQISDPAFHRPEQGTMPPVPNVLLMQE